jgi:hypothetical protein
VPLVLVHPASSSTERGFSSTSRAVGMCLAISTPAVLPSVGRKTSAPRTCLTPLNTSPAPSPVNASRLPSRTTRASLGASAVRYSFTVTDFPPSAFCRSPGAPVHSINRNTCSARQNLSMSASLIGRLGLSAFRLSTATLSNVARGLVLLFGIGSEAFQHGIALRIARLFQTDSRQKRLPP